MLPHEFRETSGAWTTFPTTQPGDTGNTAVGAERQSDTLSRNTAANTNGHGNGNGIGYPFPSASENGHKADADADADTEADDSPILNDDNIPYTSTPRPLDELTEAPEKDEGIDKRRRTQSALTPVAEG